jgi:hypothetical protein
MLGIQMKRKKRPGGDTPAAQKGNENEGFSATSQIGLPLLLCAKSQHQGPPTLKPISVDSCLIRG